MQNRRKKENAMNSVIQAVVGILMLLGLGAGVGSFYRTMKTETVLKVHHGLHSSLEGYTRKLTGTKLKY